MTYVKTIRWMMQCAGVGALLVLVGALGCESTELGPQCKKYYDDGCCLEVAGEESATIQACSTARNNLISALEEGADEAQTEAGCTALLEAAYTNVQCGASECSYERDGCQSCAPKDPLNPTEQECTKYCDCVLAVQDECGCAWTE